MKQNLTILILILLMTGCTPLNEGVLFPDHLAPLSQLPNYENKEFVLSANIDASVENTWDALILILKQRSFITHTHTTSEDSQILAYIDRTTIQMATKEEVIEMPYQVILKENDSKSTSITIICRWDLITSPQYIKNKEQRYEDLKKGMLSEAYILINQVNTQATSFNRWQWIDKG